MAAEDQPRDESGAGVTADSLTPYERRIERRSPGVLGGLHGGLDDLNALKAGTASVNPNALGLGIDFIGQDLAVVDPQAVGEGAGPIGEEVAPRLATPGFRDRMDRATAQLRDEMGIEVSSGAAPRRTMRISPEVRAIWGEEADRMIPREVSDALQQSLVVSGEVDLQAAEQTGAVVDPTPTEEADSGTVAHAVRIPRVHVPGWPARPDDVVSDPTWREGLGPDLEEWERNRRERLGPAGHPFGPQNRD